MIQKSLYTDEEWQRRLEKIHDALLRDRERARVIARQAGTHLVYEKDGLTIRENTPESYNSENTTEG